MSPRVITNERDDAILRAFAEGKKPYEIAHVMRLKASIVRAVIWRAKVRGGLVVKYRPSPDTAAAQQNEVARLRAELAKAEITIEALSRCMERLVRTSKT